MGTRKLKVIKKRHFFLYDERFQETVCTQQESQVYNSGSHPSFHSAVVPLVSPPPPGPTFSADLFVQGEDNSVAAGFGAVASSSRKYKDLLLHELLKEPLLRSEGLFW